MKIYNERVIKYSKFARFRTDNIHINGKIFVDITKSYVSRLVSENIDHTWVQVIAATFGYDPTAFGIKRSWVLVITHILLVIFL